MKSTSGEFHNILAMINDSVNSWLGLSVYFMRVSAPRDTATLKYCRSWCDSSEPATSRSAAPRTPGQRSHYLLLTRSQDGTKQHRRSFIATIHTQRPCQVSWDTKARGTVISHPEITDACCCDKSAAVSVTYPVQRELLGPHLVCHWWAEESWSSSWKHFSERPRFEKGGERTEEKEK